MSEISIDNAEKVATAFIKKKRNPEKVIITEVARLIEKVRISGYYPDKAGYKNLWEVTIDNKGKILEYKFPES